METVVSECSCSECAYIEPVHSHSNNYCHKWDYEAEMSSNTVYENDFCSNKCKEQSN